MICLFYRPNHWLLGQITLIIILSGLICIDNSFWLILKNWTDTVNYWRGNLKSKDHKSLIMSIKKGRKLLDEVRDYLRLHHYSIQTEKTYPENIMKFFLWTIENHEISGRLKVSVLLFTGQSICCLGFFHKNRKYFTLTGTPWSAHWLRYEGLAVGGLRLHPPCLTNEHFRGAKFTAISPGSKNISNFTRWPAALTLPMAKEK